MTKEELEFHKAVQRGDFVPYGKDENGDTLYQAKGVNNLMNLQGSEVADVRFRALRALESIAAGGGGKQRQRNLLAELFN